MTISYAKLAVCCVLAATLSSGAYAAAGVAVPRQYDVGQAQVLTGRLKPIAPTPAPETLTLQQALRLAFERNLSFRQTVRDLLDARGELYVQQQRYTLEAAGSAGVSGDGSSTTSAVLSGDLNWEDLSGGQLSVSAELAALEAAGSNIAVGLTYPLGRGRGKLSPAYEGLRSARSGYRQSLLSYFLDQQDLAESVISSYLDAVRRQKLTEIEKSGMAIAQQSVTEAEARLREGMGIQIDVLRAQLQLARAQQGVIQAEQSARDSMDRMLQRIGVKIGGNPQLTTVLTYKPLELDLDQAVTSALKDRAEPRILQWQIEDEQAGVRISHDQQRLRFDLVGSVSRVEGGAGNDWQLGVAAQLPINSRSLRESTARAERSLLVSLQHSEDLRQQIVSDVRSQVRSADSAKANVGILEKSAEVADLSLKLAKRMVEEGLAGNRDVIDAQVALTESQGSLESARIDYYLATVGLKRAIGSDVMADLPGEQKEPVPAATPPAEPEKK